MRIAPAAVLALSALAAQSTTTPAPDATGHAGDAAILQSLKAKAPSLLWLEVAADERTVVAMQSYWPVAFNRDLIEHNDTFVDALIQAR